MPQIPHGQTQKSATRGPETLKELVRNDIERLSEWFAIGHLKRACFEVSYTTLQRALSDLRKEKKVRCLGRGPDAEWERIKG